MNRLKNWRWLILMMLIGSVYQNCGTPAANKEEESTLESLLENFDLPPRPENPDRSSPAEPISSSDYEKMEIEYECRPILNSQPELQEIRFGFLNDNRIIAAITEEGDYFQIPWKEDKRWHYVGYKRLDEDGNIIAVLDGISEGLDIRKETVNARLGVQWFNKENLLFGGDMFCRSDI